MSCDFPTNSGVEVDLMLQTDVTSARSSWGTWRVFGGARAPPSDQTLVRTAGPHQGEQRAAAAAGFLLSAFTWILILSIRFQFRISDVWKKIHEVNVCEFLFIPARALWRSSHLKKCLLCVFFVSVLVNVPCCYHRVRKISFTQVCYSKENQKSDANFV